MTRREFLDHGAHLALGVGALQAGMGRLAFANWLRLPDLVEKPALPACVVLTADEFALGNDAITAAWSIAGGVFRPVRISDGLNGAALPVPAHAFTVTLADKSTIAGGDMRITTLPRMEALTANPRASRLAERSMGRSVTLTLQDASGRVEAVWRALLRDGSRYIRQELTLRALGADVPLREITLLDFNAPNATVTGTGPGTPIVVGNAFFGFEHPLATNGLDADRVRCRMSRTLPLRRGTALTVSSVTGVTRQGQMRRDFLTYVERERAHPFRTFLHYNSWYDLGYFSGYDEAAALAAIAAFGTELHQKRGVTLDSYLFDDGWDDPKTLWHFNAGFPAGFANVAEATHRYGAAPGVWMSPWGGYGEPRDQRIA
ncbi:MAG TPA: hypothetical protein VIF32_03105, partial [Gemmatimonadaceae bacterium]